MNVFNLILEERTHLQAMLLMTTQVNDVQPLS